MKNKTSRIDTYETPYEVYLVVANQYTTVEELNKLYCFANGTDIDNSILYGEDDGSAFQASTTTCKRRSDNRYVVLVKYDHLSDLKIDKHLDLINLAAHEATHVAINMYLSMDAEIDMKNQEVFAYNVAYFTTCILKTWMNK